MKRKFIGLILSMFLISSIGVAQKDKFKVQEKIKARRIAFITEKLQLTPDEAQVFWPLFNDFQEKRQGINKTYRRKANFDLMSDEEVVKHVDQQLEKEEKMLALKKEFIGELKTVLPIRKVAMLPRAEKRFKEWMLTQIKRRNMKNGQGSKS